MKFSLAQVRQLRRDNQRWPQNLKEVPRQDWPARVLADSEIRVKVMRSRDFLVQVFADATATRLTISRTDWDVGKQRWREDISWDAIQRLKAEAGYPDEWAVELYPSDDDIINVANMRHIWLLPSAPVFAWRRQKAEAA